MNVEIATSQDFEVLMRKIDALGRAVAQINAAKEVEWLSKNEVLALLNVSPLTLQNYRDRGLIGFAPIGKKFFYKRSDVERLLNKSYITGFGTSR